MFNFLKKHISQEAYEIYESLGVRERALKVFSRIEGLDDIKEMMLRALESSERAHTLLSGPSASAKSLFMLQIEKFMSSKVYFTEGAATTKAGLQKFIAENQDKEIIIIDEIDKMAMQHQEGLLTIMERGEFKITALITLIIQDVRDVIKIAKLCNPSDGEEDISRLISILLMYRKTGNDYN